MKPIPRHIVAGQRCRHCGAALGNPRPWPGMPYCNQTCLDARLDAVMRQAMEPAASPKKGRPRTRPKNWCAWCGDDLPPSNGKRFCGPECRKAFNADVKASPCEASA